MGCITTLELESLGLDCQDIPTGGIKNIYISNACDTILGFVDKPIMQDGSSPNPDFGKVTYLAFNAGKVYKLEFNRKDGSTAFTEAKTVDPSGLVTNIPSLSIEFPKMTKSKRQMINDVLNPNVSVLLFIETAAGTKHVLGAKYGMRASSGSGATGTGRAEKNMFTLVFTGEESELSFDLSEKWSSVINKDVPALGGAGDWSADTTESTIPRQGCIPVAPTV